MMKEKIVQYKGDIIVIIIFIIGIGALFGKKKYEDYQYELIYRPIYAREISGMFGEMNLSDLKYGGFLLENEKGKDMLWFTFVINEGGDDYPVKEIREICDLYTVYCNTHPESEICENDVVIEIRHRWDDGFDYKVYNYDRSEWTDELDDKPRGWWLENIHFKDWTEFETSFSDIKGGYCAFETLDGIEEAMPILGEDPVYINIMLYNDVSEENKQIIYEKLPNCTVEFR